MKRKAALTRNFYEQGGLCAYCWEPMDIGTCNKPKSATVDHVEPKAKGGLNVMDNFVAACRECNSDKADKHLIIWLSERRLTC